MSSSIRHFHSDQVPSQIPKKVASFTMYHVPLFSSWYLLSFFFFFCYFLFTFYFTLNEKRQKLFVCFYFLSNFFVYLSFYLKKSFHSFFSACFLHVSVCNFFLFYLFLVVSGDNCSFLFSSSSVGGLS